MKKIYIPIILVVIIILFLIIKNQETKVSKITIDIKGHVKNPGVYQLDINSKVIDAINASGGLSDIASVKYLNLAKTLNDEDVIYIYSVYDKEVNNLKVINNNYVIKNDACLNKYISNKDIVFNINTAKYEELITIKGLNKEKVKSIIDYRIKNGLFIKLEDLLKVKGIGNATFNKIKEHLTI